MKNHLFVNPKSTITVTVFFGLTQAGKLVVSSEKEKILQNPVNISKQEQIKAVQFVCRLPSYKDNVDLASSTLKQTVNSSGQSMSVDMATLRYMRFTQLLTDWNIVDQNGFKVQVSVVNINQLEPTMAAYAVDGLDKALSV